MNNAFKPIATGTAPASALLCATLRHVPRQLGGWRSRLLWGACSCLLAGCVSTPPQEKTVGANPVVAAPAPVVAARQNPLESALKVLLQDRQSPPEEREQELRRLDELTHPSPLEQLRLAQGLEWLPGEAVASFHHEAPLLLEALRRDPQAVALAPLVQWLQDQGQGWSRLRAQREQLAQQLKDSQARVEGLNNKIQELKAIERNLISRPGSDPTEHYPRH